MLERAKLPGKHRTKRDAVNVALREYVRRCELLKVLDGFGTIDFDLTWDYKRERRRR